MGSDRRFHPQNHLQQMFSDRSQAQQERAALVERLRANASPSDQGPAHGNQRKSSSEVATIPTADEAECERSPPPASVARRPRLQLQPKLLGDISIVHRGRNIEIPHIAGVIVSTLLASEGTNPICILLPSTEGIPQFAAIVAALECLASDFPAARDEFVDRYLKPGTRVRALPDGNVYIVGQRRSEYGIDGVFMYYTEKETLESNGCHLVPVDQLLRYEPTTRKLPISRSSTRLSSPKPSAVDGLAGTRAFGNTTLYKTRVILIGSRTEFERTLESISLQRRTSGNRDSGTPLTESFAWGTFDDEGHPIVLHPSGSTGSPLVAVARDLVDLEAPALGAASHSGSQLIITDRFDLVTRSLDLANRIGERQRLLLLADARRRSEIEPLYRQGWRIWEPTPWELLPAKPAAKPIKTGLVGLDQIQRSAFAEQKPTIGYVERASVELSTAYNGLSELGRLLTGEAASYDERMQDTLERISRIFFQSANWLSIPNDERLAEYTAEVERIRNNQGYIARYLGSQAALALDGFIAGIESFVSSCRDSSATPKGQAILDLVKGTFGQLLVTGSRQSLEEASAFLAKSGLDAHCSLATEPAEEDDFAAAIAFSMLRRDMFDRFIDPWPAERIAFVGYGFEVDIYKKRLRWRERQRARLEIDEASRTSLTSMPSARFAANGHHPIVVPLESPSEDDLSAFDAVTGVGRWNWQKRISIPHASPGETSQPATIVRFVGRSWMAMTEDHRLVCLAAPTRDRAKSAVQDVDLSDLRPGARIIVREGGEKDVIKGLAEQICGKEKYDRLRQNASLWREALKTRAADPWLVADQLKRVGVRRHIATVRSWLTNSSLIGPRSDEDVLAIAEAFPLPRKTRADWKDCCDAISELRGLHLSAGMRLTDLLAARCGRLLFEPAESEIAVDLELGLVWVLEVAEIEALPRECPGSILNRLQWLDSAWYDRLLRNRIKVRTM
jgi:hypothetical protein